MSLTYPNGTYLDVPQGRVVAGVSGAHGIGQGNELWAAALGKPPASCNMYMSLGENDFAYGNPAQFKAWLDSKWFGGFLQTLLMQGRLPILSLDLQQKFKGVWTQTATGIANGDYDLWLDAFAAKLKKWAYPIVVRFSEVSSQHEGYPSRDFCVAYRHVVDGFRVLKVKNVAFAWNIEPSAGPDFEPWYPGDDVVDMLGIDPFDGAWQPGSAKLATMEKMGSFAKAHRKPLWLHESGLTKPLAGATKAQADALWLGWFVPLFDYIHRHEVAGWQFTNDWGAGSSQTVTGNPFLVDRLRAELSEDRWLHAPGAGLLQYAGDIVSLAIKQHALSQSPVGA